MNAKELDAVRCAACGAALAIARTDPRLTNARAEVTLDGGGRAVEVVLFGACRECGGSVVRVPLPS